MPAGGPAAEDPLDRVRDDSDPSRAHRVDVARDDLGGPPVRLHEKDPGAPRLAASSPRAPEPA